MAEETKALSGPRNKMKHAALIQACRADSLEEVDNLLGAGANANCVDHKSRGKVSALMKAIKNRNIDIVKSLLKGGADVNLKSKRGITALSAAVLSGGPVEMLEVLLKSGASPLDRWFLPHCCKRRFFGVAKFLLDIGVDVDLCYETKTPLIFAAMEGEFETVRLLLERCEVNFERQGERALIETCAEGFLDEDNYKDIVSILLRQNLDVNFINEKGKTAIYEAACNRNGNEQIVRLLLDRGALLDVGSLIDVCDPDFDLYLSSPLSGAVRHGNINMVRLFLNLGASVDQIWLKDVDCYSMKLGPGGTGISMLMLASRYGHLHVVKELLARGADVHLRNSAGNTALHFAVHTDFRPTDPTRVSYGPPIKAEPEIILELLRNGSDVAAKNQFGESPLDMCMTLIPFSGSSSYYTRITNDNVLALLYLSKAGSVRADSQEVLSKLWDTAKETRFQTDFHTLKEAIRVVVAAGLKPTPQLTQESDREAPRSSQDPSLQRDVLDLRDWLNNCSRNATPLGHLCRTRVRASLRDVQKATSGLSVTLRRFLIMDDLELFVSGHPDWQLLKG